MKVFLYICMLIVSGFVSLPTAAHAATYADDSLIVRSILDTNGHQDIAVNDVTVDSAGRIIWLELSNVPQGRFIFNITVLPASVGRLTALTLLNIGANNLPTVPAEICSLTNLVRLDLYGNHLTVFPDGIQFLTKLIYLNLRFNEITSVPAEISSLIHLQVLELGFNKISQLPGTIGNLVALKHLGVQYNQLTVLPSEVSRLSNLIFLGVDDNRLTVLPDSLVRLSAGIKFYCANNSICTLPPALESWVRLHDQTWPGNQECANKVQEPVKRTGQAIPHSGRRGNGTYNLIGQNIRPNNAQRGTNLSSQPIGSIIIRSGERVLQVK